MSDGAFADYDDAPIGAMLGIRTLTTRALPGIAILASSAILGFWMIYVRPADMPLPPLPETASASPPLSTPFGDLAPLKGDSRRLAPPHDDSAAASPAPTPAIDDSARFGAMFPPDPYGAMAELNASVSRRALALRPALDLDLEGEATAPDENRVAEEAPLPGAPLPPRRPADLGVAPSPAPEPAPSLASRETSPETSNVVGFFQRLFGGLHGPQGQAVAYANPESTTISRSPPQSAVLRSSAPWSQPSALARYDKFTAVYDIEAKVVYLPNGARLEAHSGLGGLKDDPKYVNEHARGATPPDVYELSLREGSFHGVQALRLKPIGSGEQFGRTGLLAHPYMLGADGDSFGCVSFKDYDAFLQAFQAGQVKKLAVVAKLD